MVDIDETEDVNAKKINKQMIKQLLESGFATKFNKPIEDRSPKNTKYIKIKRDNKEESYEVSGDLEDPIQLLEVIQTPFKKDCYKNIYKNVLEAFESALKIQMEDYKDCMCDGKNNGSRSYSESSNDNITLTTTTLSPTIGEQYSDRDDVLDEFAVRDGENGPNKEDEVICFNKKFAIILKDLLKSYNLSDTQEESITTTTMSPYNPNLTRSNRKVSKPTSVQDDLDFEDEPIALKNGGKIDSEKSMKQLIEENLLLRFMEYLKTQQIKEDEELMSKSQVEAKGNKSSIRLENKAPLPVDSSSEISNEDDNFDLNKLLEELKGLFPDNKPQKETKPFHSISKSKSKRSEDSAKSLKQTKRKTRRTSSQENSEETSQISKRRPVAFESDESPEAVVRETRKNKKRDNKRRVAKESENERASSHHKSAHNSRKKISLSIDVPKSARDIIKKIKYDYE